MGMALLILSLLVSFNRTINRLTKPVSALAVFSLLSSALMSAFLYFKKIANKESINTRKRNGSFIGNAPYGKKIIKVNNKRKRWLPKGPQ